MLEGRVTEREIQVLSLVAKSYCNKEISGLLGISVNTVETHRQSAARKLHLKDIAAMTRFAIRHGLVSAEE